MTQTHQPDQIRNFAIIAHIDHGKTTLTDQLLQLTGTVSLYDFKERMMDSNPIEQEKGVTIKLAPVRILYQDYVLNLIDTPGHVDFGYEVSRSLQACEGAVLLVDATQGVQAQTLANYEKAHALGLKIVPVINKIDAPLANIENTMLEMIEFFGVKEEEILLCSAKTGEGVPALLDEIVRRVPPPTNHSQLEKSNDSEQLKALVITSVYDNHQGVVAYVRVVSGEIKQRDELFLMFSGSSYSPIEIGVFNPKKQATGILRKGEVGYVATGLKTIHEVKIGDTITHKKDRSQVAPLPGYKEPIPMVFMELYPIDNGKFQELKDSMEKLKLHDAALTFVPTHSQALGNGLRVGFLGIFHAEIVRERLQREFGQELIATAPSVKYQVITKKSETLVVESPSQLPDPSQIDSLLEPIAQTTIFAPTWQLPPIVEFVRRKRGQLQNSINSGSRTKLSYLIPLSELIYGFHDQLKSLSSGFASMEYSVADYQRIEAVKVDILVNKEVIEALSFISLENQAHERAKKIVQKLKEVVPRHLFEIPIQAAIGGTIIARETVKAFRKDVTAKLYGGDVTRRMKLLKKQTEGKKRMKQFGKVSLNQDAFLAVLES
ncbi:MAG TPA: translation elongation factor 4 [Candidatus Woesebacteria bacterium]|nr:translation elongation factor 4 [Candidatus Woesebacteria bacterium]